MFSKNNNNFNIVNKLRHENGAGFTLIELIISIFILSVAVIGVFGAFSVMVVLTNNISDRLTATYLAQEGVEIIRNIRDNNWLNIQHANCDPGYSCSYNWYDNLLDNDLNSLCPASGGCELDYTTDTAIFPGYAMKPWPQQIRGGLNGDYLNIDSNGFYSYGACATGTTCATKFKRKIIITPIESFDGGADQILKVFVTVYWDTKSSLLGSGVLAGNPGSGSITVEEYLYNWEYGYTYDY